MKNKFENGTEVLIFENWQTYGTTCFWSTDYIRGTIIESWEEDLSNHGSSWNVLFCKVLGEDGNEYVGCYGSPKAGRFYFLTVLDYLKRVRNEIEINDDKIAELQKTNRQLAQQLIKLDLIEKQKEKMQKFILPKN